MSDQSDARDLLQAFFYAGEKHFFALKDGSYFQGYLLNVTDAEFQAMDSGPFAPDALLTIPFANIAIESLEYLDDEGWQRFAPNGSDGGGS